MIAIAWIILCFAFLEILLTPTRIGKERGVFTGLEATVHLLWFILVGVFAGLTIFS